MTSPEEHFDKIAREYDYWKDKNPYYYDALKTLLRSLIPPHSRVVEIGCGTGDLLEAVQPIEGKGVDISETMVLLARARHTNNPELSFERVDLLAGSTFFPQEYLFTVDVLEHVKPLDIFLESVARSMAPGATLVVTLANPFWEWLLMLTEKLGMKMPEGPHWRLSIKKNEELYRRAGFSLTERGFRLLVPKKLPGSDWINARFYKNRLLAPYGFIVYWVLEKK